MVNLGCSACPVAFCWVLCNLTDYVVPVYSSCDCLSPLVISLRAIMLQTGDFFLYWKTPCTQVACGSRQDLSFNTKPVSIFNIRLSQSLLWPVLHIQWLIFVLSEHVFFSRTSVWHVHCPQKCLRLISPSTVNSSALKLTPATRSMINKAQYCQRHQQCNTTPSTHSHGACNLVLVLKISFQLWAQTEGMKKVEGGFGVSFFYPYICCLYCNH